MARWKEEWERGGDSGRNAGGREEEEAAGGGGDDDDEEDSSIEALREIYGPDYKWEGRGKVQAQIARMQGIILQRLDGEEQRLRDACALQVLLVVEE